MKGGPGRKLQQIRDFSGGQVTRPPVKGLDTKYSVDCLNVYSKGLPVTRRLGFTTVNTTVASGIGNGFYNWVKNATDQVMVTYFGTTLSKIDVTNGAWDGTLDGISPDSTHGTAFTNNFMHFITYNGTLIMTTDNRDKPQYIRVTDTSHFDLETGGAGTAPFAKFCEVWKSHVWLMNLGNGSLMTEDANSITSWTDNDVGTGASTQTSFDGKSTFHLVGGGTSGDNAKRTKDIGVIANNYVLETQLQFNTLNTVASGDYAELNVYNGVILFRTRFSDDGLEVYNGTAWSEVGVNLVSEDTWATYKFVVTAGTATAAKVDVYKNGVPVGLQYNCADVNSTADGQIDIFAKAGASGTVADYYVDYMYISPISGIVNYLQNNQFETWGPLNGSGATFSTASQSYLSVASNAKFNFTDAPFTIETRINRAAASTAKIALYTQGTDTANQIFFGILNNALVFSCVTAGTTIAYHSTDSLSWNTAEWYDLAFVRDGSALSMFNRGQKLGTSATTALGAASLPSLSSTIYIGAWAGTANGLAGSLDEYRVSTSARYSVGYNVATTNFTSDAATALLLNLDSNFTDSSPNAFTVTTASGVANATTPLAVMSWSASTSLTTAREGTSIIEGTYAYKLSGTGSLSQTLSIPSGIAGSSAYIAGWLKGPASGNYQYIVTDGTDTYASTVFTTISTAPEYSYFQFTTVSTATAITINLVLQTSNTWFADSMSLIPAGTVASTSDFSDRVQRSAVGLYNDWIGTDSGYNDLLTPGDVGITGHFILNDRMYVMKSWSIHRFYYTQSFPLVDIKRVKQTVGTKSPRSVKNVDLPGQGEVVIFLGSDRRLYLFDGLISQAVSDEMTTNNGLSSIYFDNINASYLNTAWAVVHPDLNWYQLFVAVGTATTPNYSITYDYVLKSLWPFQYDDNFSAGDISDNAAGARKVYALSTSAGRINLLNNSNSDGGASINSYWTSPKIGTSQQLQRIDEIEVETYLTAAQPSFAWRADWETSYVTKSMSSGTNNFIYAPGRIDNLIQFKISDNSTTASWELWTINMTERPVGVGH